MPPKSLLLRYFGSIAAILLMAVSGSFAFGEEDSTSDKSSPRATKVQKELAAAKAQLARARNSMHEAQKELAAKAERIRELEMENRALTEQTEFAVQEIRRLSKIAAKEDIAAMKPETPINRGEEGKAKKNPDRKELAEKGGVTDLEKSSGRKLEEKRKSSPPTEIASIYYQEKSAVNFRERGRVLREIREILEQYPKAVISLSGHADDSRYEETNLDVSFNRAEYLAAHLRVNGIPKDRLIVRGAGSGEPSEKGNRRVDIRVGIPKPVAKGP